MKLQKILSFIIDRVHTTRERLLRGWTSPERIKKAGAFTTATALFVTLMEIIHLTWVTLKGPPWAYSLFLAALCVGTLTFLLGCSLYINGYLQAVLEKQEAEHSAVLERLKAEYSTSTERMKAEQQKMLIDYGQKSSTRRLKVFRSIHLGLAHRTRDYLMRVFSALYESNSLVPSQPSVEETVALMLEFCKAISSGLEALHEGVRFRACIKLYVSPQEVITVARDPETLRAWPSSKDAYFRQIVVENTAFLTLLTHHKVAWASDNLQGFQIGNTSKGWEERYKRSMSVPIRLSHIGVPGKFEIVGYIAADCQLDPHMGPIFCNEKGEPEESLRDFLLTFADLAYPVIKRGKVVAAPDSSGPSTYLLDKENFAFVEQLHQAYISQSWWGSGYKTHFKQEDSGFCI